MSFQLMDLRDEVWPLRKHSSLNILAISNPLTIVQNYFRPFFTHTHTHTFDGGGRVLRGVNLNKAKIFIAENTTATKRCLPAVIFN